MHISVKSNKQSIKSVQQLAIILFMAVFLMGLTLSLLSPSPTQAEKTIEKETISSLIKPQTGTLPAQVIITDSGFIPTVLTIEVGSTVSWLNQTATTQQLEVCLTAPTSYQIYLPFILKSSVAVKQQLPTNKTTRQAGTLITATITSSGSYSHTFNTVGKFVYCLDTSPPYSHTIIVLEATPSSGDFSLNITPTIQSVIQGDNGLFTIDITALNGFTESVSLTLSGLTEGLSSTFNPNPAIPDSQSTLTVSTALSTSIGSYPLTIWGTAGDITHTANITLTVEAPLNPDFSLTVIPISQSVEAGNFVTYTVHLTAVDGFTSPVNLSIGHLPIGITALFAQNPITPSAQTILTVTTALSTPFQTHSLIIQGDGNNISHTTTITLAVQPGLPNLTISSLTISPIATTLPFSVHLTAHIQNQSYVTITTPFSLSWLIISESSNNIITLAESSWPGGIVLAPFLTTTFTHTLALTSMGVYTVYAYVDSTNTLDETNETDNKSKAIVINTHPNFQLKISPPHQTVFAGNSITYTISLMAMYGFNAPVTLTTTNLPANTTAQFSQNPLIPSTQAILTLTVASAPPLGTYPIPIIANSQNITHYVTPTLTINNEFAEGCGLLPIAMHKDTLINWQPGSTEARDIWNGGSSTDHGWLYWNALNSNPDSDDLIISLLVPISAANNFVNPANIVDTQLQSGDWVASQHGTVPIIQSLGILDLLKDKIFKVPVWDEFKTTQQSGYLRDAYHVKQFALIKLTGDYYLPDSGGGGWIQALLIDPDVSFLCPYSPNLTLQAPTNNPITPTVNIPFELSTVITNQSQATVTTPFSVEWYANINSLYPPVTLGQSSWLGGQLGPHMTVTLTNTFILTTPGVYTFFAYVDSNNAIYEINEDDNLMPFSIYNYPFDITIVLDSSGSMEHDPLCYGCWKRNWFNAQDYIDSGENPEDDNPRWSGFYKYRSNGTIYPLGGGVGADPDGPFTHPDRVRACTTDTYEANDDLPIPKGAGEKYTFNAADTVYQTPGSNDNYIIIEAELYSNNTAVPEVEVLSPGQGRWIFQRGEGNYGNENKPYIASQGTSIDDDNPNNNINPGSHMAHHPSSIDIDGLVYGRHYYFSNANVHDAPALEYDFRFYNKTNYPDLPASWGIQGIDNVAIWVRVHAGTGLDYASADDNDPSDQTGDDPQTEDTIANNVFYWKLLSSPDETTVFYPLQNTPTLEIPLTEVSGTDFGEEPIGIDENGEDNYWRWLKLGQFPLHYFDSENEPKIYRLYIYAGSTGFSIDRIVLTNNLDSTGTNGNGSALGNARTANVTTASAYRNACDICSIDYGEDVPGLGFTQCTYENNQNNIPFASVYPDGLGLRLRDNRLHILFNEWENPLRETKESIKKFNSRLNPSKDQAGFVSYSTYGTTKTELTCLKAETTQLDIECYAGTNPFKFTEVWRDIEDVRAGGDTPTALGIRTGLETLGYIVNPTHTPPNYNTNCTGEPNSSCIRGGDVQRILILISDGEPSDTTAECNLDDAPPWTPDTEAYRCPLLYAQQAAANGIRIYTISNGYGANFEFMQAIADYGNGQAYFSASGGDFDMIFYSLVTFQFPIQAKEAGKKTDR